MPSVEELLSQDSEDETNLETYADSGIEYCTVDDDTRLVTIPDKYKKLGVESDEKAKRIWFRFPKLVGNNGVDLSEIGVRVNYRNANGDGDIYIVEDLTTDGDCVTFSWELTRKVTAYKGNVSFVVCAVKSDTDGTIKNEWNTTLNKECEVLEGLEVTEQITQENPDIIEYILANLGSGGTGLSTEAIDKLEEVGNYLAYTTTDGGSKWTELISILRNGSSGGGSGETVPATGITLDKTTLSFTDSATQTLVATVEPSDTTDKIVWTSNAESVAKVTNGVVKPLSNGSATITATCGSVSATCSVTVDIAEEEQVTLTSISATYTGGDVAVGTSLNDLTGITVTAHYSDGSTANVTGYTLSGEIVEGSNTITVSYGGKSTTFTVTGVAESGGNDSSEELMSESNIVATGYTITKNVQYSFYQLIVKEGVNVYEIPVESGVTYEATITNNIQYGTPYWDDNQMTNVNANTTFAISADKFTDFSTTGRVTVTLDGNTTIDTNMTKTPNGDGTYTRRITFTPVISGYLYTDNRTSVNGNIYSIKKVVA